MQSSASQVEPSTIRSLRLARRRLCSGEKAVRSKKPSSRSVASAPSDSLCLPRFAHPRGWGKSIVLTKNEYAASRCPARSRPRQTLMAPDISREIVAESAPIPLAVSQDQDGQLIWIFG